MAENSLNPNDHAVLMELRTAILGANGQGGLLKTVERLEMGIFGDGSKDNPGIKSNCAVHIAGFTHHLEDHRATRKRLSMLATAAGGTTGAITSVVVFLLRYFGILKP